MSIVDFITSYETAISSTDKLPIKDEGIVAFGLFGEVGSILAISKKSIRESSAFDKNKSLIEELGDVLWYFSRLCARKKVTLSDIVASFIGGRSHQVAPTGIKNFPLALVPAGSSESVVDLSKKLGAKAAEILVRDIDDLHVKLLEEFFEIYIDLVASSGVSFRKVIEANLAKTLGRFSKLDLDNLSNFDEFEHQDEQLPSSFSIEIRQRPNGKTYMKKGGVFIGDPLTDNIGVEDGYRFHDVFHMSYACILHWSPVFRSLLKNKRKSNSEKDEIEDGGRAIVIEEGLSAWLFSIAKEHNYFEGQSSLSFDILKNVKQFVRGYEVEVCPYNLFEKAILDGYKVFRDLKKHQQGVIVGSRIDRSISFEAFSPEDKRR